MTELTNAQKLAIMAEIARRDQEQRQLQEYDHYVASQSATPEEILADIEAKRPKGIVVRPLE